MIISNRTCFINDRYSFFLQNLQVFELRKFFSVNHRCIFLVSINDFTVNLLNF